MRRWWKRGERTQAIGRSRGGRTTKIHALTDRFCRPIAFLLTGGQVADCTAADTLLEQMPATGILHGDKGYDSNAVRRKIEATGAAPDIPPKINRIWKPCFAPLLYRDRNAIERMFGRIMGFPQDRNTIRQARAKLPRCRLSCGFNMLRVMRPEPRGKNP